MVFLQVIDNNGVTDVNGGYGVIMGIVVTLLVALVKPIQKTVQLCYYSGVNGVIYTVLWT